MTTEPQQQIAREATKFILNVCEREHDDPCGMDPLTTGERVNDIILSAIERAFKEAAQPQRSEQQRILDWRQTLRSWKAGGFVPSIKNPRAGVVLPRQKKAVVADPSPPAADPSKESDFQRRLAEWKAKGRPLGEFPA